MSSTKSRLGRELTTWQMTERNAHTATPKDIPVGKCEMVHFITKVDPIECIDKHPLFMVFRRLRGLDPNAGVARGGSRASHATTRTSTWKHVTADVLRHDHSQPQHSDSKGRHLPLPVTIPLTTHLFSPTLASRLPRPYRTA